MRDYLFTSKWFDDGYSITETEKGNRIRFDLPGYSKENTKVTREGRCLRITAEHPEREKINRVFILPTWAEVSSIKAKQENGELIIDVEYAGGSHIHID